MAKANESNIDQTVLSKWSTAFQAPLRRFFERQGAPSHAAEDLVQEVFAKLANRPGLDEVEKAEGYVFRTAWNVLNDSRRKDKVRAASAHEPFEEKHHGSMGLTPERVIMGRQALQGMIDALHELPERTRTVFVLYHFENVRQADIAKRLGIALSTVEMHMARANRRLQERRSETE